MSRGSRVRSTSTPAGSRGSGSAVGDAAATRFVDNPFYVLALRPDATRVELERQGQKLLGMLELGLASAATYATPIGPAERTADKVRRALAELRDPERRLLHELWANLDPQGSAAEEAERAPEREADEAAPWPEALRALGWLPRRAVTRGGAR